MSYVCVCKNAIQANNKKKWEGELQPPIRVSNTPSGKVTMRSKVIGITDKDGNIVGKLLTSEDGKPIISAGAKVALVTEYDVVNLEEQYETD